MSIPTKYCLLVQAADDDTVFDGIASVMHDNVIGGHFTIFPCNCEPPCRQMTREEEQNLLRRFRDYTAQ